MTGGPPQRRPLATRNHRWAIALAAAVARTGIAPNHISALSIVWAAGAGACLGLSAQVDTVVMRCVLPIGAAVCIQMRLLCNMLDGMVALAADRRTPTGDLFNELPDRIADVLILVGAGYAAISLPHGVELGWACGVLAVLTAYIRALGQSSGSPPLFHGPMAKPQRMAVMSLGAVGAGILAPWHRSAEILLLTLSVIALGSLLTCLRRTRFLVRHLEGR